MLPPGQMYSVDPHAFFDGGTFVEPVLPLPQSVPTAETATQDAARQTGRKRRGRPPKPVEPSTPPQPMPSSAQLKSGFATVLSSGEVTEFRPILIDFWQGFGEGADKLISNTNANRAKSDIWYFNQVELESLADALLSMGKRSVYVAVATREIVRSWFAIKALLILGPRFGGTVMFYYFNGGVSLWPMNPPDMSN